MDTTQKIAVVGAGASGLTAAYTLKKLGYSNVVVFEEENRPGGKVFSYEHEGRFHELGAVWIGDGYTTIVEMARELGVPFFSAPSPGVIGDNTFYSYSQYIQNNYKILDVVASLFNLWKTHRRYPKLQGNGFADIHPDLHLPLKEFAQKYNIEVITELIASFMTGCGYGYYEDIPAMYLLKLIPQTVKANIKEKLGMSQIEMSSFTNGWQSLWQAVSDTTDVRYKSTVTDIKRYTAKGKQVVEITIGKEKYFFDHVVISAPLEIAENFMSLTELENRLFSKINHYTYMVTLFKGENIPHGSVVNSIRPDTIGNVAFIAHHLSDTDVYTAYQLLPEGMSEESSIAKVKDTVQSLGGTFHKVLYRKIWKYFPWVSQQDLDDGFYEELESIQGTNGTYYIGGLMNFETVETTAAYAKWLMEKEFGEPNNLKPSMNLNNLKKLALPSVVNFRNKNT